jgi:hypothetical protein
MSVKAMKYKTALRDREIFAAYKRGDPPTKIAETHKLAVHTVVQILRDERHKHALSADEFYRGPRRSHKR